MITEATLLLSVLAVAIAAFSLGKVESKRAISFSNIPSRLDEAEKNIQRGDTEFKHGDFRDAARSYASSAVQLDYASSDARNSGEQHYSKNLRNRAKQLMIHAGNALYETGLQLAHDSTDSAPEDSRKMIQEAAYTVGTAKGDFSLANQIMADGAKYLHKRAQETGLKKFDNEAALLEGYLHGLTPLKPGFERSPLSIGGHGGGGPRPSDKAKAKHSKPNVDI